MPLSIVFNTLMSVLWLKEKFYPSDVISLGLIGLGCMLIMIHGKIAEHEYSDDEINELYMRPMAVGFIFFVLTFIFLSFIVELLIVSKLKNLRDSMQSIANTESLRKKLESQNNISQSARAVPETSQNHSGISK